MKGLPVKKKKPVKIGNSFYFSIPKQYIEHKAIDPKLTYRVSILM